MVIFRKLDGHVFWLNLVKWFKSEPNVLWNGKTLFLAESKTSEFLLVIKLYALK